MPPMSQPTLLSRLKRRAQRGLALVTVILIMLILMVVSAGFVAFTTYDLRASDSTVQGTTCYNLAEAGLNYGLFLIRNNMTVFPISASDTTFGTSPGKVLNLKQTLPSGQEHVVISDLAFNSQNDNWMSADRYCGSFKLTMSATGPATGMWTVQLNSVGFIKSIPSGRSTTDPTQYYDISTTGTWSTVLAQRTLHMIVNVDTNVSATPKNQINIQQFYEEFR